MSSKSFKSELLKEIRRKNSMNQVELANLLGVSKSHVYKLERGLKGPSLKLVQKISAITGIPADVLLSGEKKDDGDSAVPRAISDMKDKLKRECQSRKRAEKLNAKKDRVIERLTNLIELHIKFEDAILGQSPSWGENSKKLKELAKDAAKEGKAGFGEIRSIFRIGYETLRNWLWGERRPFPCRFAEGGQVMASTPGEAALRLRCFDCAAFEAGGCLGHGHETRPENIVELIKRLAANGVTQRREQSRILSGSYGVALPPHKISEAMYKDRHGLHISERIFYMEMTESEK
jgi:transcriptional regulator with XRE-family HTH domain